MNIRDTERIRHNTKIIATLGRDMIIAGGLNVIRFNFSHGDAEFHRANAEIVREAARQARQEVAIMADLQGPKIRLGTIAGDNCIFVCLREGVGGAEFLRKLKEKIPALNI